MNPPRDQQLYHLKDVEPWLLDYIPSGGNLALDIGANNGTWSRYLADRFRSVHAFEPQPLQQLRNLSPENVRLFEVAVGDSVSDIELFLYPESWHASTNASREGALSNTYVPQVTLDSLGYRGRHVDFIKIDVEGYEVEVLSGAQGTILASLPRMIIEIHNKETGATLECYLPDLGYPKLQSVAHPNVNAGPEHRWLLASMEGFSL